MTGILQFAALILSLVNGLMLLRTHLRDRPILTVNPVHPEVYQWWFHLPDGEFQGMPTRRYGFLLYVGIGNRGLRKVALKSWRLVIKTGAERREHELKPLSIPEPTAELVGFSKTYPVLGVGGLAHGGGTVVESGCSISGWAYFVAEYYGSADWKPIIKNDEIKGTFLVRDIFGGKAKTTVAFSRQELGYVSTLVPGIETIGQE